MQSIQVSPEMTADSATEPSATLRGRWLVLARVTWLVVTAFTLGLFVASVPVFYDGQLQFASKPEMHAGLLRLGLSADFYATLKTTLHIVSAVVFLTVAGVIFWRKSHERMALFVALLLVLFGIGPNSDHMVELPSILEWPVALLEFIRFASIAPFFYLFPDGRFVPRWTRWLAVFWIALQMPIYFFPDSPFSLWQWPPLIMLPLLFGFLGSLVFAQVYRYIWVSGPIQRQQTKWVVFSLICIIVVGFGALFMQVVFPSQMQPDSLIFVIGQIAVAPLSFLLIPLSIGMAILRYRLWDIDAIINRTLVYGALTATLVLVYFGSVVGLQRVLTPLIGQDSQVAIVASTLAIAALFNPLRRRIQAFIDRRFYRRKYDAAQVLAAFAATARDEVDLDKLTAELVHVVEETLQPEHVSLWLREPEREVK